jgi:hypothetical protein
MVALRTLSQRPEIIGPADSSGAVIGVVSNPKLSAGAPLGRARVVSALPTNKSGPVQLKPPQLLVGGDGCLFGDPDGNVIGQAGVWCHRMVYAAKTLNTRRL